MNELIQSDTMSAGERPYLLPLLLLILLVACVMIAPQPAHGKKRKLVAASSNNFPPVNDINSKGRLVGFGVDLAAAVARDAGFEVEHVHSAEWVHVLKWIKDGKADFIHDTGITPERDTFLDFTDPILEMPEVIFTRMDTFDINGIETLKGKRVACVNRHISHLYLMEIPGIDCHVVDTPVDGLYHLLGGDVDALVYPREIVLYLAQERQIVNRIKVTGEPLRMLRWGMAVKEGNSEVLALLNDGIRKVKQSGQYDRIYEKWFGKRLLSGYSKQEVVWFSIFSTAIAVLTVFSVLMVIFNLRLKSNRQRLSNALAQNKESGKELLQSQERLSLIFDGVSDGIIIADASTARFYMVNNMACRMFGYTHEEMLRLGMSDIHPPETIVKYREEFDQMARGQRESSTDLAALRKNGEIFYVDIDVSFIELDGKPYLMGLFRDVTERKDALLQLKTIVGASLDGFWATSDDGRLVDANEVAAKMLGYTHDEFIGMSIPEIEAKESPEETLIHIQTTIERGYDRFESVHRKKDGTLIDVEISTFYYVNYGGKGVFFSFVRDISERNRITNALRESEEKMRTLIENIPLKIFTKDTQSAYISCNQNLASDLGIDKNEIPGKTDYDFFSKELADNYRADDKRVMESGKVEEIEERYVVDGGDMVVHTVKSPLRDADGRIIGILGIFQDITDRKVAEESLKERQREIEELNRSLEERVQDESRKNRQKDLLIMQQSRLASMGEMIGHIAHQWRQPLNALSLTIFNVRHFYEEGTLDHETLENLTARAGRLIQKMSHTIDDFRNFFKPNREKQRFSINDVVHNSLSLVEASFEHNDTEIRIIEDKDVWLNGFPNEYSQVLLNILNNSRAAIQESRGKGVITIEIKKDGAHSVLRVRDNGGGISKEIMGRIFEPYYTTKDEGQGTGLGLYMSKVIIEEHMGGSLSAANVEGGAEIVIAVPLWTQADNEVAVEQ